MGESGMRDPSPASRARRRELRLAGACFVWAVCFAGARLLLRHGVLEGGVLPWLVAAVPTAAGAGLLIAFLRYLRDLDELQRAIQIEALALGFGGGFLAVCAYLTFVPLGAPLVDAHQLLAVMPVLYALATLAGRLRYG